jgi:hypothetical protein
MVFDLDRSSIKKLTACLSYATVSVSMTLFNKAVFSVYQFNFPNFVTTLQIIISIVYMLVLENLKWLEIEPISMRTAVLVRFERQVKDGKWPSLKSGCGTEVRFCMQVFPLTFFWWLYVVSGVTALRYLTVPMFRWVHSPKK